MGEETHGTHEFIDIKARLVEFLISNMGFTTLVMENDWGSSQLLDMYINGGPGTMASVMSQSLFGSWQTQEYEALFEWMRAYNANPAHTTKIHFLGMDIQALSQSDFAAVENYVQQVDPQQVASVRNLYAPILSESVLAPAGDYEVLDASTKQKYQNQAQQVYDLLQANQQHDVAHSSSQRFALALQNARIIVQLDGRNLGGELHARYNQSYLPIGTTLDQGTFRTYTYYPSNRIQTISPPISNTYNYTLGQAGLPLYMLNLRSVPLGSVDNWVRSSSIFLLYGLGGQDNSTRAQLSQWFDVIIHIQNTTPSHYFYASTGSG